MPTKRSTKSRMLSLVPPNEVQTLFGEPPLLRGEDVVAMPQGALGRRNRQRLATCRIATIELHLDARSPTIPPDFLPL
jgi:hypothetical protein